MLTTKTITIGNSIITNPELTALIVAVLVKRIMDKEPCYRVLITQQDIDAVTGLRLTENMKPSLGLLLQLHKATGVQQ